MFKKLAVILRGHKRTWDYVKHNQFSCFEQLAETVDYYMVVWDVGNISRDELILDFTNRNLKYLKLCTYVDNLDVPSQEYHVNLALPKVFQEQYLTKEQYCAIIETRPDMAFDLINPDIPLEDLNNSLGVSGPTPAHDGCQPHERMLQDTCFMYNFYTGVLWNSRNMFDSELQKMLRDQLPYSSHNAYYEVAESLNIRNYTIPWFKTVIARPSIIYHNDPSKTLFDRAASAFWQWQDEFNAENCLEACRLARIDRCEYIGNINNSKSSGDVAN